MTRGWTSRDLPVIDDEKLWTVADAAHYLGPLPNDPPKLPVEATMTKLRILSRFHLKPVGKRRTTPAGHPGRYARVYAADDFIHLYEQLNPETQKAPPAAA